MPTLDFWYDFASSYSHPAAMTIARRAADAGVEVRWRPFLLGAILNRQRGLTDIPFAGHDEKLRYVARDLERTCRAAGVAWTPPSVMPRNSLPALRAALAVEAEGLSIAAFSRAVFDANFGRDQDIGDVGRLGEILAEIDMPGAAVLQRAQTPEIKDALKAQTEEAHTLGVFGAPTFTTPDGELFWGFDHMDEALKWAASPPQES
ncbi:MAG: 2-hydroxychromene-2-carboxylate isomerase [Caulobacteraceae bacterium]|nr:2-hydroxychromene-2-carboxylate isomerase [Caulobacter sp.]